MKLQTWSVSMNWIPQELHFKTTYKIEETKFLKTSQMVVPFCSVVYSMLYHTIAHAVWRWNPFTQCSPSQLYTIHTKRYPFQPGRPVPWPGPTSAALEMSKFNLTVNFYPQPQFSAFKRHFFPLQSSQKRPGPARGGAKNSIGCQIQIPRQILV